MDGRTKGLIAALPPRFRRLPGRPNYVRHPLIGQTKTYSTQLSHDARRAQYEPVTGILLMLLQQLLLLLLLLQGGCRYQTG